MRAGTKSGTACGIASFAALIPLPPAIYTRSAQDVVMTGTAVLLVCSSHVVEDIEELVQLQALVYGLIVKDGCFGLGIVGRCFDGVLRMVVPWSTRIKIQLRLTEVRYSRLCVDLLRCIRIAHIQCRMQLVNIPRPPLG